MAVQWLYSVAGVAWHTVLSVICAELWQTPTHETRQKWPTVQKWETRGNWETALDLSRQAQICLETLRMQRKTQHVNYFGKTSFNLAKITTKKFSTDGGIRKDPYLTRFYILFWLTRLRRNLFYLKFLPRHLVPHTPVTESNRSRVLLWSPTSTRYSQIGKIIIDIYQK